MDGIHDLGGKQGFGRVDKRGADKAFHARWEAAVFAMMRAAGAAGAMVTSDRFRHSIERIDPRAYLDHGYYGRWLGGVETLLVEAGLVSQQEINERALALGGTEDDLVAARPGDPPDPVGPMPTQAHSVRAIEAKQPRFSEGDIVLTRPHGVDGHTRLPAYARGREGRIVSCHDGWVYPDSNAHGQGESPQFLYTVSFSSEVLWGRPAGDRPAGDRPGFSVRLDLFEPYLEAVGE